MKMKVASNHLCSLNKEYLLDTNKKLPFVKYSKGVPTKVRTVLTKKERVSNEVTRLDFVCLVSVSVTFILVCGFSNYSGAGKAPMYGDYEAQRHWMEVTRHLPVQDWYRNTSDNDLQYWGLDYPPLTAYHSYFMGFLCSIINSSWIELHISRGVESVSHKTFMRLTALFSHLLVFFPAAYFYFMLKSTESLHISKVRHAILFFFYPGLIIVDHGHFQYNSVSLGLFLAAYSSLVNGRLFTGSVFFVLALNYKQMELYHSLPIFVFILGRSLRRPLLANFIKSVGNLCWISVTVLGTFYMIWLPFIYHGWPSVLHVIQRNFPVSRGMYEDKVASFWCAFSWIIKLNRLLAIENQIKLSALTVLLTSLPSLVVLFLHSSARNFRLCLFIVSLNFFLFSYQVHEKSILLPAILYSLCLKDENANHLFVMIAYGCLLFTLLPSLRRPLNYFSFSLPLLVCLSELLLLPPPSLPHLFPLLSACLSCSYFMIFLAQANLVIIRDIHPSFLLITKWTGRMKKE